MLDRDLTDIIRENEESADSAVCRCRVVVDRRLQVSISTDHCELHGPKADSAEFARIEAQEAERRLANGE